MQKRFRLTRSEDFKRVRSNGRSYAHPLVVLTAQSNPALVNPRVGLVAGKSVGGAVQRNRAKRLLRESIRPLLGKMPPQWDITLIARPAMARATLQEVCAALHHLLSRAKILTDES